MQRSISRGLFVSSSAIALAAASASAQYINPTPYVGFSASSPFASLSFNSFFLENFEDGSFNTPFATPSAGWVVPAPSILDSVDEDDGSINGTGASGRSYYSNGTQNSLTITFSTINGSLPTHAGIVWTDVGQIAGAGGIAVGPVLFEAFGPGNVSLGVIGPFNLGDGLISGETTEDRFIGIVNLAGISAIRITMPTSTDWEIDHVQYGVIPTPSAATAMGLLALGAASRRRRATAR